MTGPSNCSKVKDKLAGGVPLSSFRCESGFYGCQDTATVSAADCEGLATRSYLLILISDSTVLSKPVQTASRGLMGDICMWH